MKCPSPKTSSAHSNSYASGANRRTGTGKMRETCLAICPRMKMSPVDSRGRLGAVRGSSLLLRVCLLSYTHLLLI